MTRTEIGAMVEELIRIRDRYEMDRRDKDTLADACNLIYHNEAKLADE